MMKLPCALGAALALAACANSVALNARAAADVTAALAQVCPLVDIAKPYLGQFNGTAKSAYDVIASACPPNPPPTNAIVAAADLLAAYEVLKPYATPRAASGQ